MAFKIGIGNIDLRNTRPFSWTSWWTTHLFDEANLILRATGRSGLNLPASIGTTPTLLPAYYKMLKAGGFAYVNDNGGLDVGANIGFTLCGWCNCTDVSAVSYKVIGGKYIDDGVEPDGFYGIIVMPTNKNIWACIKPTGAFKYVADAVDASTLGWFFYRMDINQSTLKLRLFINEVQIGTDVAYTGTFPALDNMYHFGLSVGNYGGTGATYESGKIHHSDTWVIKRLLTPTEASGLMNNRYSPTIAKSDVLAYWPCDTRYRLYDVTENGFDLTVNDPDSAQSAIGYSIYGSPHAINKGYSLYKKLPTKPVYLFVPDNYDSVPLTAPTVTTGYFFEKNVVGNTDYFNLAGAMIRFALDSLWNRSNTTIWSDKARAATTFYDAGNPTDWHSTEFTQDNIDYWLNDDYKDINFVKVITNSINQRTYLEEIYSWATPRTDLNLKKVLTYTNDFESMFIHFTRVGAGILFSNSNRPIGQYFNGKTYFAYQGNSGDPYIQTYTHTTRILSAPVKIGTNPLPDADLGHGYPSMLIDSSGYILVGWGAHYTDLQYAISTNPEDITSWTAKASPGNGSYFQFIQLSDGTIYMFYRKGNPAIDGYVWQYKTSVDGGNTWSAITEAFHEFGYMRFVKGIGDTIHVSAEGNQTTGYDRINLYYAFFEGGVWHKDDGTPLVLPVHLSVTDIKIHDSAGLGIVKSICTFDSNNKPIIAFAKGDNTVYGIGDHEYYFIRWTGAAWVLTDLGVSTRQNNNGVGTPIVIDDNNLEYYLITSKNEAYLGGNLEKWKSTDGGVTFVFDSIVVYGNVLTSTEIFNHHDDAKLAISDYMSTTTEWVNKGYLYGNSGLIKNYKNENWRIP